MNASSVARALSVAVVAHGVILVVGCTDLSLAGGEQLSCTSNAECPSGLSCAPALRLCVAEDVVAETPIAVAVDAAVDAPRISRVEGFARTVVTVTFTKAPVGDVIALVDNRLSLSCEADDAAAEVARCAFDAREFPDEGDGAYDIVVVGKDGAGNEARSRAGFELDTTAPGVAPDVNVRYEPAAPGPLRDVSAVGPVTRALVQLSVTEASTAPPTLAIVDDTGAVLAPLQRDAQRSAGLLQLFVLEGAGLVAPDGSHGLRLSTVDDVGNAAEVDIAEVVVVDATAPAAVVVDDAERVVFERVPWGTRDNPQARFNVIGAADAAEPGATVLVTSTDSLASSLLGTTTVGADGAFVVALQVIDLPRVFVHVVDGAGNIGPAARVHDVVWTASLGQRVRGDDFSNPHALFNVSDFDEHGKDANLRAEPRRAGDLVDGDGFVVDAVPARVEVRTDASNQPRRMAGAMGYLPSLQVAVLFGGVASRGGPQLTDTLVQRNGVWTLFAGERPPVSGPLAYDSSHEVLVSLLRNGDTWSFDGFAWRQLPVDRPSTTGGGPIAWDPVHERLIALQNRETWSLGDDGVWQLLNSDAPLRGERTYDGSNLDVGGVLAFDGINGRVVLYGNPDGSPTGGLFSLDDNDTWVFTAAAPQVTLTAAVEDPDGRVHFVCRSTSSTRNTGDELVWTGAEFTTGAVNPEPRSGCSATYDVALDRIVEHGGTFDDAPNNQALPTDLVAVLDRGAAWQEISPSAPTAVNHNKAGSWHYNPLLDLVMMRGADTGGVFSRTVTLWDGEKATVLPANPTTFNPPFFDGVNTRVVDFNRDQIFVGGTWVARTAVLTLPQEAMYDYDVVADAAFGFGGFGGFVNDGTIGNESFFLRDNELTVLSPSTSPPPRSAAALRYDAANDRVILAGGVDGLTVFGDAWAFEAGDWHPLDDLPLDAIGATGRDVQLLFDRARGVMVAAIQGHLFDLRGSSWVERVVDVAPRKDALAVYDERKDTLLFVGGLDFKFIPKAMFRYDIGAARAAEVARFDVTAAGAANDAVIADVTFDVEAGATGGGEPGVSGDGVEFLVWGASSFASLQRTSASAAAPASFSLTKTRDELGVALRDNVVVALRSAPTGSAEAPARLVSRRLEMTLRYREP